MRYNIINGIGEIAETYNAFILDIWGVLHDGIAPFAGTLDCLQAMKDSGKPVCLLSNTPDSSATIVDRLIDMGIERNMYHDIVTAGDSAAEDIKNRSGHTAWYASLHDAEFKHDKDLTRASGVNLIETPEGADFVINDLYDLDEKDFENIKPQLQYAAHKNLPMICGNPDLVVNVGKHLKTCPGKYAAYYEDIGGTVAYHGKPYTPVYELAREKLGAIPHNKILAVGDSLHTDIQGANGFGIDSVFNIAGIHWEEIAMTHAPSQPDEDKIVAMIDAQDHKPDYVLCGFKW